MLKSIISKKNSKKIIFGLMCNSRKYHFINYLKCLYITDEQEILRNFLKKFLETRDLTSSMNLLTEFFQWLGNKAPNYLPYTESINQLAELLIQKRLNIKYPVISDWSMNSPPFCDYFNGKGFCDNCKAVLSFLTSPTQTIWRYQVSNPLNSVINFFEGESEQKKSYCEICSRT